MQGRSRKSTVRNPNFETHQHSSTPLQSSRNRLPRSCIQPALRASHHCLIVCPLPLPLPLPNLLKKQPSRPGNQTIPSPTMPSRCPHATPLPALMPYPRATYTCRCRGPPALPAVWALRPRFSNNQLHGPSKLQGSSL